MAINALKAHILDELKTARAELQAVKPEDLNYTIFTAWMTKWHGTTFVPANRVQDAVFDLDQRSDHFDNHGDEENAFTVSEQSAEVWAPSMRKGTKPGSNTKPGLFGSHRG